MTHDVLTSPYVLEYSYKRTVGPVIGRFLGALREGRIEGVRSSSGRVIVPPTEYDETGAPAGEPVPVGPGGVVLSWSWVHKPLRLHPLDRPFAWALIRLDGADTALLHAVDAGQESLMQSGLRVRARFRAERKGELLDLACFEPEVIA